MSYNYRQICLPDKFLPGKKFIEYHNDVDIPEVIMWII